MITFKTWEPPLHFSLSNVHIPHPPTYTHSSLSEYHPPVLVPKSVPSPYIPHCQVRYSPLSDPFPNSPHLLSGGRLICASQAVVHCCQPPPPHPDPVIPTLEDSATVAPPAQACRLVGKRRTKNQNKPWPQKPRDARHREETLCGRPSYIERRCVYRRYFTVCDSVWDGRRGLCNCNGNDFIHFLNMRHRNYGSWDSIVDWYTCVRHTWTL